MTSLLNSKEKMVLFRQKPSINYPKEQYLMQKLLQK